MSIQRFDDFETNIERDFDSQDINDTTLSTKLERRRRIEDLVEEKRLREELDEF